MAKKKKVENGQEYVTLTPEEFVAAWQACSSADEAREKIGPNAVNRAKRMIAAGVNLNVLSSTRARINPDALNKLIKSL